MSDKDDPLRSGSALEGPLFQRFLQRLSEVREPRPGERIGAWRIVRELGRGGSGVVFLAERADGAYSQEVALKWLRGDRPSLGARQALERERELLAGLDHPNIARLIDGGRTDDGMLWFAMDYVDGELIDRHCRELAESRIGWSLSGTCVAPFTLPTAAA
jgi:eukaryotic-like serine/threonine-protein kinase